MPALLRPEGRWAAGLAGLYYVALLSLSSIPGPELPQANLPGLDKLVHVGVYAGLGWILGGIGWPWPGLLFFGAMAGAADEIYQLSIPGRQASVWDWLADTLGVGAGLWLRARLAPVEARS